MEPGSIPRMIFDLLCNAIMKMPNKSITKKVKWLFALGLFVWLTFSLYKQIKSQPDYQQAFHHLLYNWSFPKIVLLSVIFLLMFFNWALEAKKWQILLRKVENLTWLASFSSVLTGLSVSILTPNRIGEYLGRIMFLKNTNKLKGISMTIVGSFAQLLVTGTFGIIGLSYYLLYVDQSKFLFILFMSSIMVSLLLAYIIFHLKALVHWTEKFKFLKRIRVYIEIVKHYDKKTLWQLLAFASLRYVVYSLQFYILLCFTHDELLTWKALPAIFLNFWVIAIVPGFAIADVSIRGNTAITFLAFISINKVAILSASILLWFINLIIPALVGTFLIYKIKLDNED